MKVGSICVRNVATARPEESVEEAARRMDGAALGTLVVVDALSRPLGIASDRDLALRCLPAKLDPRRTPLERVMSAPVAWVHEEATLEQALDEMRRLRVRRLPVVDARERLVGILTLDDALLHELPEDSPAGRALRAQLG